MACIRAATSPTAPRSFLVSSLISVADPREMHQHLGQHIQYRRQRVTPLDALALHQLAEPGDEVAHEDRAVDVGWGLGRIEDAELPPSPRR